MKVLDCHARIIANFVIEKCQHLGMVISLSIDDIGAAHVYDDQAPAAQLDWFKANPSWLVGRFDARAERSVIIESILLRIAELRKKGN